MGLSSVSPISSLTLLPSLSAIAMISISIKSRIVYNLGEDHVWSEVLINGSWKRFDSTRPKGSRFDDKGFYERPRDKGGWGKQLSYVYTIDPDGSQHDVTSYYTKIGKLL